VEELMNEIKKEEISDKKISSGSKKEMFKKFMEEQKRILREEESIPLEEV